LPPPPRPSDASAILPAVGRGKTPLTSHSITRQGDILSSIRRAFSNNTTKNGRQRGADRYDDAKEPMVSCTSAISIRVARCHSPRASKSCSYVTCT
jgi:hypothetical protein